MRFFQTTLHGLIFLVLILACGGPKSEERDDSEIEYSPEIAEVISQSTAGTILPDETIAITFVDLVVAEDQVGKEVSDLIEISPSVSGKTSWASRNRLVFEPEEPLSPRVNYTGRLDVKAINAELGIEEFNFKFYVEGRELVSFSGDLELFNPSNPQQVVYRGKVVFSQNTSLEEVIAASSFSSSDLTWSQEGDRTFSFVSDVVDRGSSTKNYNFVIDAGDLNLEENLEKAVKVVPLSSMELVEVQKDESGKKPRLMLKFSDQLDTDQNIDGFVAIKPAMDLTTQKMGGFLVLTGDFKFGTSYTVEIQPGLKSKWGTKTVELVSRQVNFTDILPQAQFASGGMFMPTSNEKKLQFLTTNLKRVHVEIKKVFDSNVEDFFQREQIQSAKNRNTEFRNTYVTSVGAIVYNQTLDIGETKNEWLLHNLDLSKVFSDYQNGFYLIRINFNPQDFLVPVSESDLTYVQKHGQIYKPFTISDIGVLAKYGDKQITVFTTDLKTGQPLPGVKITNYNYDRTSSGTTNAQGVASLRRRYNYGDRYLKATLGDQVSVIKHNEMQWNNSGFDIGGINPGDLKTRAYIYTERGVYRPGDSINLSTIVRFSNGTRDNVPVKLRLINPEGTMVYEHTETEARDGFYNFGLVTDMNAPTGNWNVNLQVGNKYFYHTLKIETVVANRLKVKVASSLKKILPDNKNVQISVESKFLFGTPSSDLPYATEVQVFDVRNPFPSYSKFSFKDEFVDFERARNRLSSGNLDSGGKARVNWVVPDFRSASSPLKAKLTATVQEDGGRPNDSWTYVDIHPFTHYVGISNNHRYLKLNTKADIPVVVVDHDGKPVAGRELTYRIYRNDTYWWYQYNTYRDFRLRFKTDKHTYLVEEGTITSGKPYGQLPFQPSQKGQYLIEVQDAVYQGHQSSIFASAYPWGGMPSGDQNAGTLVLATDKGTYEVGESANVKFPSPKQGNILLTVEQGDKILSSKWVKPNPDVEEMTVPLPITNDMTPNVYVTVTALQPHAQTVNDRPIRMFGILPITVVQPTSKEALVINMPDELRPKQKFEVDITNTSGKQTQFTVAVVDEGLLDLTNFKTPDPWKEFYKKIRLSISTFDLFGFVIGANAEDVFKTFSIGGDDDYRESQLDPFEKKKRFKPVSMFKGPITTDNNGKATVSFEMPNYVGSVRVMVISADGDRYGTAEKTVPVKSDLIVLPTIPRALKPGDEFKIPVNVFATRNNVGAVSVDIATEGPLEVIGNTSHNHTFSDESDQMFHFRIKVKEAIGQSRIVISAKGKDTESTFEADVAVSPSAARIYEKSEKLIKPGETITMDVPKLGLDGTNNARVHLAVFPNLDFIHRLQWLIRYPYGCIEQTTSSVYPQLALKNILKDDDRLFNEIDQNINSAIYRLSLFQLSNGSFSYWPGSNEVSEWGSNYAGQFLIEAREQGYAVPDAMYNGIVRYLGRKARQPESEDKWLMTRVNRCFVLALADKAAFPEMNLLKQNYWGKLNSTQKWQLVTAYKLAGAYDKVQAEVDQISTEVEEYSEFGHTYGSRYRDLGIILRCLVILDRKEEAALMAKHLAEQLSGRNWYSTQSLGQMLLGIGNYFDYAGISADQDLIIEGELTLPNGEKGSFKGVNKIAKYIGEGYGGEIQVKLNDDVETSQLYVTLSSNGVPLVDETEDMDKNIRVGVTWYDEEGDQIDMASVKQGEVFYGKYTVSNTSVVPKIDEVALVQLIPSGWEIENTRLSGEVLPDWLKSSRTGREEYMDIRDDRIMWFFDLDKTNMEFVVKINAITEGSYVMPGTVCEAMYNSDYQSTKASQTVEVTSN